MKMAVLGSKNVETYRNDSLQYKDLIGVGCCNFVKRGKRKNVKKSKEKKNPAYINIDPNCHGMIAIPQENMHLVYFQFFAADTNHNIKVTLRSCTDRKYGYDNKPKVIFHYSPSSQTGNTGSNDTLQNNQSVQKQYQIRPRDFQGMNGFASTANIAMIGSNYLNQKKKQREQQIQNLTSKFVARVQPNTTLPPSEPLLDAECWIKGTIHQPNIPCSSTHNPPNASNSNTTTSRFSSQQEVNVAVPNNHSQNQSENTNNKNKNDSFNEDNQSMVTSNLYDFNEDIPQNFVMRHNMDGEAMMINLKQNNEEQY